MQLLLVCLEVFDGSGSNTALHRCLHNSKRDVFDQARIKRLRNEVLWPKTQLLVCVSRCNDVRRLFGSKISNRSHCCHFHFFVNSRRAAVERAAEDEGETENVINLIRVVRSTCCNNGIRTRRHRLFGHDFGNWVRHREDDRLRPHLLYELAV